jgi:uncharacterized protein YcnI
MRLAVAVFAAFALLTSEASAHIQVSPTVAAPGDAVKFTVLVPGERDAQTTRVRMRVPAGLLPFSWQDTPGWTRKLVTASNGAVEEVIWSGRLPKDGFVEFSFLAGTPPRAGALAWKTLQTYSDGKVVSWIGSSSSEFPAPVTKVLKGAPLQNAGGESRPAPPAATPVASAVPVASVVRSRPDWFARIVGIGAAVLALVAVGLQSRRRRTLVR